MERENERDGEREKEREGGMKKERERGRERWRERDSTTFFPPKKADLILKYNYAPRSKSVLL